MTLEDSYIKTEVGFFTQLLSSDFSFVERLIWISFIFFFDAFGVNKWALESF